MKGAGSHRRVGASIPTAVDDIFAHDSVDRFLARIEGLVVGAASARAEYRDAMLANIQARLLARRVVALGIEAAAIDIPAQEPAAPANSTVAAPQTASAP